MRNNYKTFLNLKDLKVEIISLAPLNDSANYLVHLLLNVLEIMSKNDLYTANISHTFYKDVWGLITCQTNSKRIEYFKKAIELIIMDFSLEDYSIVSIPKEWSWLPIERCDYESENENIY